MSISKSMMLTNHLSNDLTSSPIKKDDEFESAILEEENFKIYSIDQSDKCIKRYDLVSSNGYLKLYLNSKNELKIYLSDSIKKAKITTTAAAAAATTKSSSILFKQYFNQLFEHLDFNCFKIKNNKLTMKFLNLDDNASTKSITNNNYYYGIEADYDHLIDIRTKLINLRDIYLPEWKLLYKKTVKIDTDIEKTSLKFNDDYTETAMSIGSGDSTNKDDIELICNNLCLAIKFGAVDEACLNAKKLALLNLDIKIILNNSEINNEPEVKINEIKIENVDESSKKIIVKNQKSEKICGNFSFDVNCLIISNADNNKNEKNKNIYLDGLDSYMSIADLKKKAFNEYKIPIESQYWVINDCATDDNILIHNYLNINEKKNVSKDDVLENLKFHLFLLDDDKNVKSSTGEASNDEKMIVDGEEVTVGESPSIVEEDKLGWKCKFCTFINEPTRNMCDICTNKRPADYVVPDNYKKIEKAKTLQDYLAYDLADIIENTENFDCDICMDDNLGPREGVILKECLHLFCKGCIRDHILHCDDAVVKCPYSKDYTCQATIQEREMRALVSKEEYEKLQLKSLKEGEAKIANTFHCKTPDCIGFCVHEDNLYWFECPVCEKTNCLRCNVIHMGQTCDEYKEDLKIKAKNEQTLEKDKEAIEKMVVKGEAMHCPGCKMIVLKDIGCDWCQCLVCKMEICWATRGPRWGPKGHGDTSGGCKCNLNGKLCHPKCGNCH